MPVMWLYKAAASASERYTHSLRPVRESIFTTFLLAGIEIASSSYAQRFWT